MTKSLKASLRKSIVGIVMMSTIFSLSGIAAVIPAAHAATYVTGDLIRNPNQPGMEQFDVYVVKTVGTKMFKRLILNPAIFNSYGNLFSWKNVKTVSSAEMNLFKTSGMVRIETGAPVYAVAPVAGADVGSKSWLNVSAADFVAAGGDWDAIYTVNTIDGSGYTAATDLTTQAQVVTYLTTGALPGGVVPPVTGAVTVSLAATTPASATLVSSSTLGSQALAPMVDLNFANGTNGAVNVTTLNLTRTGIAADTDLSNLYLYDGNTKLAEMTSVSNRVFTFVNGSGLFTVAAGATKTISVKADVVNSALSGKTIGLGINAASDVVTNGGTVGGTYPINGNVMSTATVTDIGRLTIGQTVTAPASVDPGVTGREIMRFSAVAANQNLKISYIKLTNVGTIAATDLANIKLMDGATQLGATAINLAVDGSVVFDLTSAPLIINSGNTKSLTVLADVVGGTNRTFRLTIQRQADVVAQDTNYGINIKPFTDPTTNTFAVIQANAVTLINTGTLTVAIDTTSPTGNVALNSTNITLAKFKFIASGEAVKVTSLPIQLTLVSATNLKNVKLVLDGTQVGTTLTSLATGTPTTMPASGDFGSSFIIPVGTTGKVLSIVADISATDSTLAASDTIVAQLNAGATGNAQGQVSMSSITTSAATGRLLTVASGLLTVAKNLAMNNGSSTLPTAVKGTTGAKIGSFVLTSGAGEGTSVSQIQLIDTVTHKTQAATIVDGVLNAAAGTANVTVTATGATGPFVVGETYRVVSGTIAVGAVFTVTAKATNTLTVTIVTPGTGAGTSITIGNAASGDTLADVFQNMRLMNGTTQVGNTIGTLTDTAATAYTFTPATAISIAAGQQITLDVYADVKSNATTLSVNADTDGILEHTLTTATGLVTNGSANTTGTSNTVTLQNVYVAGIGALAVAVSGDSSISAQTVMGTTAVELAKFKLTESTSAENLNVTQVIVTDTVTSETHGTISNIQLVDGTTVLGTVASVARVDATTGTITFTGLNITVPKGGNKVLTVRADITPYPGATAGATHVLTLASAAITGTGASSGSSLGTSGASGNSGTMTAVRTKITIAKDTTSPSGTSGKSTEQTVAVFSVSNSSNVANADAVLSDIALDISTGGTWVTTTTSFINIYKDSVATANKLGTSADLGAKPLSVALGGWATNGDSNPVATSLKDLTIASGTTVKLLVTANTNGAPSNGTLTVSIPAASGIKWEDGVSTGASAYTTLDSLPVTAGTLTF